MIAISCLRIGVNLGDVMVEGSDLYGDGVNIAARLKAIAEPGGILRLRDRLSTTSRTRSRCGFDDLGAQAAEEHRRTGARLSRAARHNVASTKPRPLPDKPSIAVLPFTNMSGDPEQEYFCDGITEDIITELSRFRRLFVIARNSTFAYKGARST